MELMYCVKPDYRMTWRLVTYFIQVNSFCVRMIHNAQSAPQYESIKEMRSAALSKVEDKRYQRSLFSAIPQKP
jgi:hypothetical protein